MSTPPDARRAVVIGGGVIGVACTHYLLRAGWQVTLVDRGAIGRGSSHGNCGLICPSHVLPLAEPGMVMKGIKSLFSANSPFAIKPRLDPALWSWLLHFAARCNERDMVAAGRGIQALLVSSLPLYRELFEREGLDCEFESRGLLFAYRSKQEMDGYTATDRLMTETFACPARRCDGAELVALEPALRPGLAGGWYYHDDVHVRPDKLMKAWRQSVADRGALIHEDCPFERFQSQNGRATAARTPRGDLAADLFVVAAGAWTPLLNRELGCRVPIQPGKGYSMTMPRPAICPKIPLIFPETRVAVTPFQSGYRLGSTMEFAGYDETLRPERLAATQGWIRGLPSRALLRAGPGEVVRLAPDDLRQPADHRSQPVIRKCVDRRGPQHAGPFDGDRDRQAHRRAGRRIIASHRPGPLSRWPVLILSDAHTGVASPPLGPSRPRQRFQPFASDNPRLVGKRAGVEPVDCLARYNRRHPVCPAARMNQGADEHAWIDPVLAQRRQLERPITFGEPAAVGFDGQGNMPEPRLVPAGLAVQQDLPGRARDQVGAADHLRDAHRGVVGDDGKLIGMVGILPRDDEVAAKARRVEGNSAQKEVVPLDRAWRHTKPPGERTIAKLAGISNSAACARSRIRRPFVLEVRSARSPADVGPRARARIDALALLQPLEHLAHKGEIAPTDGTVPKALPHPALHPNRGRASAGPRSRFARPQHEPAIGPGLQCAKSRVLRRCGRPARRSRTYAHGPGEDRRSATGPTAR